MSRQLNIRNPTGIEILGWIARLAGYRMFPTRAPVIVAKDAFDLPQLQASDWSDVLLAAQAATSLALFANAARTRARMEELSGRCVQSIRPLETGLAGIGTKGFVMRTHRTVVIAFEATKPNEIYMNAWSHSKELGWSIPRARYVAGRQVHSFYLDLWTGMRDQTFAAIKACVDELAEEQDFPRRIIVTGHSMGGGVSVLAMMDIIDFIRETYGRASGDAEMWADEGRLCHLVRHVTFAEFAAAGPEYAGELNRVCEMYQVSAWDFVHPHDITTRLHLPFFRARRGQRYVLPHASVRDFEKEYAAGRHDMHGYLKSMEWLAERQPKLRSLYTLGGREEFQSIRSEWLGKEGAV